MSTDTGITALILAGGAGTRMQDQDKGLVPFRNKKLIEHVIDRLTLQVDRLIISANRNIETYRKWGYPVVTDDGEQFKGPLAGIAAARHCTETPLLLIVPCDAPFLHPELAERLLDAMQQTNSSLCCAHDGKRLQPLFALVKTATLDDIDQWLAAGNRRVHDWADRLGVQPVDFSDVPGSFANLNTLQELLTQE